MNKENMYSQNSWYWGISLVLLLYMFLQANPIYIQELDLCINATANFILMLILTVFLTAYQPAHKIFIHSKFIEFLYYCIPIIFQGILIFMQYHFEITVILAVSALFITLYIYIRHFNTFVGKRRYSQSLFLRIGLLIFAGVFLIPFIMAIYPYQFCSPRYEVENYKSEVLERIEDTDEINREELIAKNSKKVALLKEEQWKQLSIEEKVDLLQLVLNIELMHLGISDVSLATTKLDTGVCGKYSSTTKTIVLDLQLLNTSSAEECVNTIIHEVFHAFQLYVVDQINWEEDMTKSAYFKKALAWKKDTEMYQSAGDGYYEQELEVDARAYSETTAKIYFPEL